MEDLVFEVPSRNASYKAGVGEWIAQLQKKRGREYGKHSTKWYSLGKKLMKDLRKYVRMLFNKRFERKEWLDGASFLRCVAVFLDEVGWPRSFFNDIAFFLKPKYCRRFDADTKLSLREANQLYDKMNTVNLRRFLKRPCYRTLVHFLFGDEGKRSIYVSFLREGIKSAAQRILQEIVDLMQQCGGPAVGVPCE